MILVQHISKRYLRFASPAGRLASILGWRPSSASEFWALRDVSFRVSPGEFVSLIGPNGSGKSTLLQVICGIVQPTAGRVRTRGRIAALLELGAGFNPEFTGRENVISSCELLGLSSAEIAAALPRIEDFASIGDFLDRPVKEYSSGMYVRLAFATAIHVQPEILVVDEALAVGDAAFSNRCIDKFEELRRQGVTVLFVSHDLGLVKRLSDRTILMLQGRIYCQGEPKDVVDTYVGLVLSGGRQVRESGPGRLNHLGARRHGDGTSTVESVDVLGASGLPVGEAAAGEPITIRVRVRFHAAAEEPMVGILLRNRLGMDVFGTNTQVEGIRLGSFRPGDCVEVSFTFPCWLTAQEYAVTAACQYATGHSRDWVGDAVTFRVLTTKQWAGVAAPPVSVSVRQLGEASGCAASYSV